MAFKKSFLLKTVKYTGITLATLLILMLVTPYIFAEKINAEIKKIANEKLSAKLDYSKSNVSFFNHFPSLTVALDDFS